MSAERMRLAVLCAMAIAAASGCSGGGGAGGGTPPITSPTPSATALHSATPAPGVTPTATPAGGTSPTPIPSAAAVMDVARSSDSFVDSIGVNTHLGSPGGPYDPTNFVQINALLQGLHIRHVRDSAYAVGNNAAVCNEEQSLVASGIRFDYTTQPAIPPSQLATWTTCAGPALESYEAPNEYDIQHPLSDTNWPATLQSYEVAMYAAIKGNPVTANVPVLGPTFTTENAYQTVGSLATALDYGNMHDGLSGFNPGTTGYGSNGYGSIAYNVMLANFVAPGKPVIASETGYTTASRVDGVTPAVQATYMPRLFFDFYNAGIVRTYDYELIDEPSLSGLLGSFGIVSSTLAPKPAYAAIASLLALLADPGPAFTPQTISYGIAAAPLDLRHTTLQKRDGSVYIALWREYESWDPNAQAPIAVAPVTIDVVFPVQPASATLYTYDASESLQPKTLPAGAAFPITVNDSVQILRIVPAAGVGPLRRTAGRPAQGAVPGHP